MKLRYIILLILALAMVAGGIYATVYFMTAVRDEIDITDSAVRVFSDFEQKALNGKADALTKKEQKMIEHWNEVSGVCRDTMEDIVSRYSAETVNEQAALTALDRYTLFPVTASEVATYKDQITALTHGREAYEQAINESDPVAAALLLCEVSERDSVRYSDAKYKLPSLLSLQALDELIDESLSCDRINDTLTLLERLSALWPNKSEIAERTAHVEEYRDTQANTVTYRGSIEVLSVRNLMAFPETVFAEGSKYANNYDSALITPKEFTAILESLYKNNYILIPIESLEKEGNTAEVKVPKGKKPVVIVIEDLTYPSANAGSGTAGRLALDDTGALCTVTGDVTSYDNESVLILNDFARTHPDFVFHGARGCISLTGFDGILGYRDDTLPQAQAVIDTLRGQGWTFACNSYGYADMQKASTDALTADTEKWLTEIGAITGDARVYVWPYGSSVRTGEKHKALYDRGFKIFCGIGVNPYRAQEPDGCGIFLDRKPLSGASLRNYRDDYLHLFDSELILDPIRPKKDDADTTD